MTDEYKATIDNLTIAVRVAQVNLKDAERRLKTFQDSLSPVQVGDIVRHKEYGECRVVSIDTYWKPLPWVRANPRRKDGAWSKIERHLYGAWEKV